MFKLPALLVACAALTVGSASAQVFKCKNDTGKTVYSDAPCAHGAQQLDPNKLNTNTLDGSYHRRAADEHRAARQMQAQPDQQQANQALGTPGGSAAPRTVCPTALEIRNMETSARSQAYEGKAKEKERDFLWAEIRRARACSKEQTNYTADDWKRAKEAQQDQGQLDARSREAARSQAESIHSGSASDRENARMMNDKMVQAQREAAEQRERKRRQEEAFAQMERNAPKKVTCGQGGCNGIGESYRPGVMGDFTRNSDGRQCRLSGGWMTC